MMETDRKGTLRRNNDVLKYLTAQFTIGTNLLNEN